jgi:L-lactate dehydrogenase complex protein LldG
VNARDEILARTRLGLTAPPAPEAPAGMEYPTSAAMLDRFVERLVDYKADVTRCTPDGLAAAVGKALDGVARLVVPADLPGAWLSGYTGEITDDLKVDDVDAVVTGCAVAIAETGTIVLDAGPAQGSRALSLIPDRHVCVVRHDQVHPDVPDAVARLTPTRPLTWISGPSATSDIELNRVEGVHGPRHLHVILVATA